MVMKKKSFVLSWGRKMFFGLGWALTSLVALNYLQSMIIPHTASAWIYFITTFIGHYGVLLSLLYFVVYCPIVTLLPSYYVARFSSILLLIAANLLLFIDSYFFARFRFHADSFLWKFMQEPNALNAFGFNSVKISLIVIIALVVFVAFWIQGERIWRYMQTRFSNPVKNWYLVLILICAVISHSMYMYADARGSQAITRVAALFPLNYHLKGIELFSSDKPVEQEPQGFKDFYYPSADLNCAMKEPKNILLIVLDKWDASDFNEYLTPSMKHYASHGIEFQNHFSGGLDAVQGYFSLMYGVSPIYASSAIGQGTEPALISQMKKNKLELAFFKSGSSTPAQIFLPNEVENPIANIESHLAERDDLAAITPFLMSVYIDGGSVSDKDLQVKTVVDLFIKHKLIENTIVVMTGAYADMKTPLIVIWPDKDPGVVTHFTSHYDVMTTIMKDDFRCKNKTQEFSQGKNMFSSENNGLHVAGDYSLMKIYNLKAQTMTSISTASEVNIRDLNTMSDANDKKDIESILNTLKDVKSFYRRQ